MPIMNIVLGTDALDPKFKIQTNLVPKLKCAQIFMKVWHSGHFKISFNNATNFIKALRNVKTLKSFFSGRLLCTQSNI